MLSLALTRLVFAGRIRRQRALARAGEPVEPLTGGQVTVSVRTLTAIAMAIAFTL
ncbi:hypothetical protein [Streptomyces sp. AC627_RSS907]|uniref:hypothetical protein n=1 Tax=Streptomyces sp. AC627_RSS907 TaxID=2823684 RepID=UPI001C2173C9|nr:hypothetical protein [Streptomyces sp. AC627_RSS907]